MIQKDFADKVVQRIKDDKNVIGVALGGSMITDEIDEFSDLDIVLVTSNKISIDKKKMLTYANKFGSLLSAFTGEHVGDTRVLICLYDKPLLHVDIKFLTLREFHTRVEDPIILFDTKNQLLNVINSTKAEHYFPGYQWIEDRFWCWIHNGALKLGRSEYFEAINFIAFLREKVISPLLLIKNKSLPKGLRRVEKKLSGQDLERLKSTIAKYDKNSIYESLNNIISIYRSLRKDLYPSDIRLKPEAEKKSVEYFMQIKKVIDST
ncbi:MAG: aminoglycoside 6-adenylyltransferase [Bacteroidota bacterium]|nr:aminoglycoside 6-adenylyltransferase [Bacteroidota bacterium]